MVNSCNKKIILEISSYESLTQDPKRKNRMQEILSPIHFSVETKRFRNPKTCDMNIFYSRAGPKEISPQDQQNKEYT